MTSRSSLTVLLDPAWPALGDDSVGKNARKALLAANITPADAEKLPRAELARVPGLGATRINHVDAYLRRLAAARVHDAQAVAREAGKGKPGHCPDCGDPFAVNARNVFTDLRGQYVSPANARREGPRPPWCQTCHDEHRAVLGILVDA